MTYEYIYDEKDINQPTFVLLHGTGGSETDLLQTAKLLDDSYNVIAIRGDVNENGALRFFKRNGHGNYDVDDLNQRGQALLGFILEVAEEKGLDPSSLIPVGFSNGSNIAINMLLREGQPFQKAILMAPMYPVDLDAGPDLSGLEVFLSMGEEDPITPLEDSKNVVQIFEDRHAKVTEHWTRGHTINREVVQAAKDFL